MLPVAPPPGSGGLRSCSSSTNRRSPVLMDCFEVYPGCTPTSRCLSSHHREIYTSRVRLDKRLIVEPRRVLDEHCARVAPAVATVLVVLSMRHPRIDRSPAGRKLRSTSVRSSGARTTAAPHCQRPRRSSCERPWPRADPTSLGSKGGTRWRAPGTIAGLPLRSGRVLKFRRMVLACISNHHVGPDIEIELFMLTPDEASERSAAWLARGASPGITGRRQTGGRERKLAAWKRR